MYSVRIETKTTGENRVVERFNDVVLAIIDGLKAQGTITIKELAKPLPTADEVRGMLSNIEKQPDE